MVAKKLKNLPILHKLISLIVVSLLPVIILLFTLILSKFRSQLTENKFSSVKNLVESTYSVLSLYEEKARNGELSTEEAQEKAIETIKKIRYDGNNYFWINDLTPKMILHPVKPKLNGKNLAKTKDANGKFLFLDFVKVCQKDGEGFVKYFWPRPGETYAIPKVSFVKLFKPWGWIIGSGIYIDDIDKEISSLEWKILLLVIISIAISSLLAYYISKYLVDPVKELISLADEISAGNYEVSYNDNSTDELGHLGETFNQMIYNVKEMLQEIKEKQNAAMLASAEAEEAKQQIQLQQAYLEERIDIFLQALELLADGDLSAELHPDNNDTREIKKLFSGLNTVSSNLREVIGKVNEMATNLASAATEISSTVEQMAAGSQEQSSQANEVAGAVEEISMTISENTNNTHLANDTAQETGKMAEKGSKLVRQTVDGINSISNVITEAVGVVKTLGNSSQQIGEIVKVINDIADQTNLLALNAAIEAARAGEHGRGFAVVADEVRKLAENTAVATNKIADMITRIQDETGKAIFSIEEGATEVEKGKKYASESNNTFNLILEQIQNVSNVIHNVATASEEQTKAISEISTNIEAISAVTEQSASGITEVARAVEDLNQLASALRLTVEKFRI